MLGTLCLQAFFVSETRGETRGQVPCPRNAFDEDNFTHVKGTSTPIFGDNVPVPMSLNKNLL